MEQQKEPVYAYLRVSSAQQSIDNSFSYQSSAIENYCKIHGYEVTHYFKDEAKSGTSIKNRTGLNELIKKSKVKSSKIKTIVIFKLERMFRSTVEGLIVIKELMDNGYKVISTQEDLRDQFNLQLNLILAERYSSQLSGYTISSMTTIAKNHQKYLGGPVLFGYMIDEQGHYVKHPTNSKTVEIIFQLFSQHKSYEYIKNHLNDLHLYNSKGKPWGDNSSSNFYDILKNPRYYGLYRYGVNSKSKFHKTDTIEIEDGCEAIVSKALFEECNQILSSRRRFGAKYTAKRTYLLSSNSLIKCGVCGNTCHGEGHGASGRTTYRCKLKTKCSNIETNSTYVDTLALQILTKFLKNKKTVKEIVKQVNQLIAKDTSDQSTIKILEEQLRKCNSSIENLLEAIESGLLSENIKNRLHEQEKEKAGLEQKLLSEQLTHDNAQAINENQVKALLEQAKLALNDGDDGELKELMRLFYSEVIMDRERVEFHINISGFFGLDYALDEKVLTFDRDLVVKYKGNLNRIMFRQQQAEIALAT